MRNPSHLRLHFRLFHLLILMTCVATIAGSISRLGFVGGMIAFQAVACLWGGIVVARRASDASNPDGRLDGVLGGIYITLGLVFAIVLLYAFATSRV
jgi:hypothetical protein